MTPSTTLIAAADRIFVAGHRGMAGSAICRALQRAGYTNLLTASRTELDLGDGPTVQRWFAEHQPTVVVLAAAKVGGIAANNAYPADFLLENLKIQTNVIETAWRSGVKRLLFLGSSCIYPKFAEQPIREEALLTGALEPTNEWYAIAKITGIKLCEALRRQHGFDAISLMPTNLYGPGDNYHPTNSHVLPALIRRFHEAAEADAPRVTCWGTGTPLREFLHVDDLGEACVFALERWQPDPEELQFLNVGTGLDLTIRELAEAVAAATGYQGEIHWDASKPDGTPKKQLDVSRLAALGWSAHIPLAEGLSQTICSYLEEIKLVELRK
jgi:GDP-L-fucose synthase